MCLINQMHMYFFLSYTKHTFFLSKEKKGTKDRINCKKKEKNVIPIYVYFFKLSGFSMCGIEIIQKKKKKKKKTDKTSCLACVQQKERKREETHTQEKKKRRKTVIHRSVWVLKLYIRIWYMK